MKSKDYDLIVSLVKAHRKYPDYEAILDDIVNDVYEHAKVVINSVANEEVILAYLNKVISTSMVTVPKKMNFNTRVNHRIITTIVPEQVQTPVAIAQENCNISTLIIPTESIAPMETEQEEVFDIQDILPEEGSKNTEEISTKVLQDDAIESVLEEEFIIAAAAAEEEEETLELAPETTTDELEVIEETLELAPETTTNELEVIEETLELELDTDDTAQEIIENTKSSIAEVDKSLVDKMINGVSIIKEEENGLIEDESSSDTALIYDTLEEVEPIEDTLIQDEEVQEELSLIEPTGTNELLEQEPENDIVLEKETTETTLEPEELTELTTEDSESAILDLESAVPMFNIEEMAEETLLEADDIVENLTMDIEPTEETGLIEENDLSLEESILETDNSLGSDFNIPEFTCFNYIPEQKSYNTSEIYEVLNEYDVKYPSKKILQLCDLKYNQKLSIEEIANTIGFDEREVLNILKEIIDIVKDY